MRKMIYKNIELHGVSEIYEAKGGIAFRRIPEAVIPHLSEAGQNAAVGSGGVELRFVPNGEVYITLSTLKPDQIAQCMLYFGSVQGGTIHWPVMYLTNEPRRFRFNISPDFDFLAAATKEHNLPFSPEVIRIVCNGAPIVIHSIEGDLRPPKDDEKPSKTALFYGSSITHGSGSVLPNLTYPFRTAEKLGIDHINCGFPASCHFEKEMADHLTAREDWDFMVVEIGINMLETPTGELRALSHYLVSEAHKKHPDKYIFCIDIFRHFSRLNKHESFSWNHRAMIKEMAESFGSDKIIHLPALDMLGTYDLLAEDHVHPSIEGHFAISNALSEKIKPYLDKI